MMIDRCWLFPLTLAFLTGCQSIPESDKEELRVSRGVEALFHDPTLTPKTAGERIRCERQRRVGTHRIVRVCMTWEEWEAQFRSTQLQLTRELHRKQACEDCGGN